MLVKSVEWEPRSGRSDVNPDTVSLEESAPLTFNVAINNKTYLGRQVKCPIFAKFGVFRRFS